MENPMVLVEYVRGKDNRPIGVIVATGRDEFGWSLCAKADRKFGTVINKKIALDIAVGRSLARTPITDMPKSLFESNVFDRIINRSGRYFK